MSEREAWLSKAVSALELAVFTPRRLIMPKWAVSCGWVKGQGQNWIGICVDPVCAEDGVTHLFIVPSESDPLKICRILVHEMVHAVVGTKEGHGGAFATTCRGLGMQKPWSRALPEPETEVHLACEAIASQLGPYPHAPVTLKSKPAKPNNWVTLISKHDEKYTIRTSLPSLQRSGFPLDPWGSPFIAKDAADLPEDFEAGKPRVLKPVWIPVDFKDGKGPTSLKREPIRDDRASHREFFNVQDDE